MFLRPPLGDDPTGSTVCYLRPLPARQAAPRGPRLTAPPLTLRRFLFVLAALAVLVIVGLPVARLVQPGPERAVQTTGPTGPSSTPAVVETVQLGAEGPPPTPISEVPDAVEVSQQTVSVFEAVNPSVVFVEVVTGPPGPDGKPPTEAGSGVIISSAGHVLTNAHVVARGIGDAYVYLPADKREYRAEVIGQDPTTDIAVLRLLEVGVGGEPPLPVASLGDSDDLRVGEWVLAIGSPFGLNNTLTSGVVSALGRSGLRANPNEFAIEDFVQTDAAINQGNSGGALVNLQGEVVGVVTAIVSNSGFYEGYGLAVPMNLARRVAEDLIQFGEVRRGYLGVVVKPVDAADARERGMGLARGVLVENVVEGGPADRAGLRPGDVLLEVADQAVNETGQFQSRLAMSRPNAPIGLTVWRGGEEQEMRAVLADPADTSLETWFAGRSEAAPRVAEEPSDLGRSEAPDWGVRFRDLTAGERRRFESGAYVEGVTPGSAAELDGLPPGTIVVEIENRPIATAAEAQRALARQARLEEPALLRVRRPDGRTAFYDLVSPYVE